MAEYVDSPSLLEDEVRELIASVAEKHAPKGSVPDDEAISKDAQDIVAAWAQMTALVDVEDESDKKPAVSTLGTMIDDWSKSRTRLTIGRSFIKSDAAARDLLFDMIAAVAIEMLASADSESAAASSATTIAGAVALSIRDVWKGAAKLGPDQMCIAYAAIRASRAKSPGLFERGYATTDEILQNVPREPSPEAGPRCKRDMAAIWGCPYLDRSQQPYLACALGCSPSPDAAALAKVQEVMGSLPDGMFDHRKASDQPQGGSADSYKYNV